MEEARLGGAQGHRLHLGYFGKGQPLDEVEMGSEPMSATGYGLLSALAHDLGPAAFERVWTSEADPMAAYETETGDPLHTWVAQHVSGIVPEYHAGPLPPIGKLTLLGLLITATAGGAIRLSRRRLS